VKTVFTEDNRVAHAYGPEEFKRFLHIRDPHEVLRVEVDQANQRITVVLSREAS
jgi:hypothetical protein